MTEMQMQKLNMLSQLVGDVCMCGGKKIPNNTFCRDCYYKLPQSKRNALYKRVGNGYEQAYQEAIEYLHTGSELD